MKKSDGMLLFAVGGAMLLATFLINISVKPTDNSKSASIVMDENSNKYRNEIGLGYKIPEEDQEREEEFEATNSKFESFELSQSVIETAIKESANTETAFLDSYHPTLRTQSDAELIMMEEDEMWDYLTAGLIKSYPTASVSEMYSGLSNLRNKYGVTIRVPVWYWKYPNDDTNFEKVKQYKTFYVNKAIAQLFKHAFEDIFNHESKPVINLADTGAGCWNIRGKTNSMSSRISTHAVGAAIDLNPSTGSFNINGTWYGNGFQHQTVTEDLWKELPECHNKYHVLYDGSTIVNIFKSYGFVWGGDWESPKDSMHLSFIGEGVGTRQKGQSYYLKTLQ